MKRPGDIIGGKWRIEDKLGRGGQGQTYLVTQVTPDPSLGPSDERYVAKVPFQPGKKAFDRFKNEIRACLTLDHPNILRIIDANYDDSDEVFFVTRYCSSGPLTTEKLQGMPILARLKIFHQICAAIVHAHHNGVIHRDIKPGNIFLEDLTKPVIGDFGICFFPSEDQEDRLTNTMERVGPVWYMAPELAHGRIEEVTADSDVYSLGKLLYWLLSGGAIFDREYHRRERFNIATPDADMAVHWAYRILDATVLENPKYRISSDALLTEAGNLVSVAERGQRLLSTAVPQRCVFCQGGFYRVHGRSPHFRYQEDIELSRSMYDAEKFGLDFSQYEVKSRDEDVDILFLVCDHCGNVQQFRLDKQFGGANRKWEQLPQKAVEVERERTRPIIISETNYNPRKGGSGY